ncbi:ABC transporter ATP-binding protein [Paenibacillus senegalensis]|uniref:ABC transporter ATP-binding protein n=1 Tax=Paenibacillus senegalensis TaxID=1465766 RepID=UPI00028966AD|nr:ABC transporter ATP-binding protein [Paenibacillus senegalensis]
MTIIAEVNQLSKNYKQVKAVDSVSFKLEEGKIYGLLGRNGAGKTTIMQMLTAQMFPTSGGVKLFGEHPYENNKVLSQVCFIKESQKYPDYFNVADVLDVAASFFENWDAKYADQLVELFRLPRKRAIKKLSRGMLSSVGVIIGLASRAPLTIFDEPYLGLDAVARSMFYDELLHDYSQNPRTIVLSTHLIDEVNRLLEHVILIDQGRLLLDDDTESLRNKAFKVAGVKDKVEQFVEGLNVVNNEPFGGLITATVLQPLLPKMRQLAAEQSLEIVPLSLQDLIILLTKQNPDSYKEGVSS